MRVDGLEKTVSDLQRDNEGLKQALLGVSTSVEGLIRKISMLEQGLAMKTDINHVQKLIKQSDKQGSLLLEVPITLNGKEIAKKVSDFTNTKERF
ncbi:hypothetical protein GBN91_27800 [Bacillus sp. B1-WWTP-T-0.5-Post-4]|nr:hypothetical protein GBN91_27800 [Bacillus sp. B1-WWTP-T-0.5-Post-4]